MDIDYSKLKIEDYLGINEQQDAFINEFINKTHSHAYLVSGNKDSGKLQLCNLLANKSLGIDGFEQSIDCLNISLESLKHQIDSKNTSSIGINAVRELIVPFTNSYSIFNNTRFVILEDAELLTEQAQNALLKPIEEPKTNIVFFLISDDSSKIISTLKSRCKKVYIHTWDMEKIKNYLTRYNIDEELAYKAAEYSKGLICRANYYINYTEEAEKQKKILELIMNANKYSDIISFSAEHAKDNAQAQDNILNNLEYAVQEALAIKTETLKANTIFVSKWEWAIKNAPISQFVSILEIIAKTREMRSRQLNWQACLDYMLAKILEETKKWQQ